MALPEYRMSAMNFTVGHWVLDRGEREYLDLNAPYQRGSVWTVEQRRNLIKSMLMGLPVGSIIVSVLPPTSGIHYRVIDGKQRVEAVLAFTADEFAIPADWLRDVDRNPTQPDRLALRYSQTSEQFHRRFEISTPLPALEFKADLEYLGKDAKGNHRWRQRTDAETLAMEAEVYGLVNFGGVPQTEEDRQRAARIAEGGDGRP